MLNGSLSLSGSKPPAIARTRDDRLVRWACWAYAVAAVLVFVLPLATLLRRSLYDRDGGFVGLANYAAYVTSPALLGSLWHSLFVAFVTSAVVVPMAFAFALALTRTAMPGKPVFRFMATVPLVMPGMLKAIALIYLFGNQGMIRGALFGHSIYGPIGIILASILWTFPQAFLMQSAALLASDQRLDHAARALGTGRLRTFLHVVWPGCRYGVIASFLVVFIAVFTDFGIAKVIGGDYDVLATDIYKEVVGQQNFEIGAVISVVLMIPAALIFLLERHIAGQQRARITGKSVPFTPARRFGLDMAAFVYCAVVSFGMVAVLGIAQFAALVRFWPYNLSLTLDNYSFEIEGVGWINFWNSLVLAGATATFGVIVVFVGAYLVERPRHETRVRKLLHAMMIAPMAVPGLVLGLSYLMFINIPGSPQALLYGGMAVMVLNTLVHLYGVPHLACVTAMKSVDREIDAVALTLRVPTWRMIWTVMLPVCVPALVEAWIYFFLRAMTTLSGIIFLYVTQTTVAAIAVIHTDETGRTASAAAMAMLIVYTCIVVRLLHAIVARLVLAPMQKWRAPRAA